MIEKNGLSIVDVTDPTRADVLRALAADGPRGERHAARAGLRRQRAAATRDRREGLRDSHERPALSYEVLDVTDPAAPTFIDDDRRDRHVVAARVGARQPRDAQVPVGLRDGHRLHERHGRRAGESRACCRRSIVGDPARAEAHPRLRPRRATSRAPRARTPSRRSRACTSRSSSAIACTWATTAATTACCRSSTASEFLHGERRRSVEPTAANLLRTARSRAIDLPSYWGVHTAKPIYGFDDRRTTPTTATRARAICCSSRRSRRRSAARSRATCC